MPNFRVECQELVTFEIEADTKEEAEEIAYNTLLEKCVYEPNSFDWGIEAYELNEKKEIIWK